MQAGLARARAGRRARAHARTRLSRSTAGTAALLAITSLATLAACTSPPNAPTASAGPSVLPPAAENPPPITLPEQSLGTDVQTRIADSVTPPTNRWYSSLAFGEPGLPVFPKPLSFAPTDGGFAMGLTEPVASANAIVGAASGDLSVAMAGATGFGTVTRADPVGVELSWGATRVTLAQGWPVVSVRADAAVTLTLGTRFEPAGEGAGLASAGLASAGLASAGSASAGLASAGSARVGDREYGVVVRGGTLDGANVALAVGGSAQFFAVPRGGTVESFAAALGEPVGSVGWQGAVSGDSATTTLRYGASTVVTMPVQRAADAGLKCELGTYLTIDGDFAVCEAGSVSWSVPAMLAGNAVTLAGIAEEQREAISLALEADVAALAAPPSDSYFGGKYLARALNLLTVAHELGDEASAKTLRTVLADNLRDWGNEERCATGEARCFVYDPRVKGTVGVTPSFGSEDFNDHHFHYGYLLYAAAGAVQDDPALAEEIGAVFDQVAADIAGGADAGGFPAIRNFDPVAGHSWASGFAPFGDANNQESSSEAVFAWNAVAMWAKVRGNDSLEQRALWMLSSEADAAIRLWLAPDVSAFPAYQHEIVAIEWGGKRDYATWFSAEPSAMLGIQLIPMGPTFAAYLSRVDADHAARSIAAATPGGYDVMFGDYVLMYATATGVENKDEAWDQALALADTSIDDGNSRAYLLAWLAALPSE